MTEMPSDPAMMTATGGHADENAVFDDAASVLELLSGGRGVGEGIVEVEVEDEVAVVGDGGLVAVDEVV